MDLQLKGKKALVCGSTAGIGKATAMALAAEGADVVLMARNAEKLAQVKSELVNAYEGTFETIQADFDKPNEVKEALAFYLEHHEGFDILVNNSGGPKGGPAHEAEISEYMQAFQRHLVCNQHLVQGVLPHMKQHNYGRIINVISTSVKSPLKGLGVSNTVRGAVANWSKTLSNELGPYGITVNNVLPGATYTGRLEEIIKRKAEKAEKSEEEIEKSMLLEIPAHRFAKPEETADAITFLASERAAYINGINLPVDGGRLSCL